MKTQKQRTSSSMSGFQLGLGLIAALLLAATPAMGALIHFDFDSASDLNDNFIQVGNSSAINHDSSDDSNNTAGTGGFVRYAGTGDGGRADAGMIYDTDGDPETADTFLSETVSANFRFHSSGQQGRIFVRGDDTSNVTNATGLIAKIEVGTRVRFRAEGSFSNGSVGGDILQNYSDPGLVLGEWYTFEVTPENVGNQVMLTARILDLNGLELFNESYTLSEAASSGHLNPGPVAFSFRDARNEHPVDIDSVQIIPEPSTLALLGLAGLALLKRRRI